MLLGKQTLIVQTDQWPLGWIGKSPNTTVVRELPKHFIHFQSQASSPSCEVKPLTARIQFFYC